MGEIDLEAGQLAPNACGYQTEQERFEAYVAAIIATLIGAEQWQADTLEPGGDGADYWLQLDADGRPIEPLLRVAADGGYDRWVGVPAVTGTPSGSSPTYELTFVPPYTADAAYMDGRRYVFTAPFTSTGVANIDVDGNGPIPIRKYGNVPIATNDIPISNAVDVVVYGGIAWLQTPVGLPAVTADTIRALYLTTAEFPVPAAGSAGTTPNPRGEMPISFELRAVCKIGVDGYSVGDELLLWGVGAEDDNDLPAYTVSFTASTITVAAQVADSGQQYAAKAGGIADWAAAVAATSWALKCIVL